MILLVLRSLKYDKYYQTNMAQYSQVHNKWGGQNKRGGFKDFEKLLNGGVKISGGGGDKI